MALLSFDEEMNRARKGVPFANGYEFDSWFSIWCAECRNEGTCPLLVVALNERTPGPWLDVNPGALNRYVCEEFESVGDEAPTVRLERPA